MHAVLDLCYSNASCRYISSLSSCCQASTPEENATKSTLAAWVPLAMLLIISGAALLIANEYLPASHDWSWLKDGSLFDRSSENIAKLQLLIPIMGIDLLLLVASLWLYCRNKKPSLPTAANGNSAIDDNLPQGQQKIRIWAHFPSSSSPQTKEWKVFSVLIETETTFQKLRETIARSCDGSVALEQYQFTYRQSMANGSPDMNNSDNISRIIRTCESTQRCWVLTRTTELLCLEESTT